MSNQSTMDRTTVQLEIDGKRPVILPNATTLADEQLLTMQGHRETIHRARLLQDATGVLAFATEQRKTSHTTPDEWSPVKTKLFESYDAIQETDLDAALKLVLRAAGKSEYTYTSWGDPPYTTGIRIDVGRDIRFNGAFLANGTVTRRGFPHTVHLFQVGSRYRVVLREYNAQKTPTYDDYDDAPQAAAAVLGWYGRGWYDEDPEEPAKDAIELFKSAATRDDAFQPIAYTVVGGPDPMRDLWMKIRATWLAEKEAKEARERERIAARNQREEEERREAEERWQQEQMTYRTTRDEIAREPTVEERARELLIAMMDDEQAPKSARTMAAAALYRQSDVC